MANTVGKFIVGLYRDEKGQIQWELHEELVEIFTFIGANSRKAWSPAFVFPQTLVPLLFRIPISIV